MGVIELFDRGAALFPDRACLVEQSLTRSYRDVTARTFHIAAGPTVRDFAGRRVAAPYSPNCVAAFECMLGIFRARSVYAPVNACAHPAESVHILNYCGHDPVNSAARS